MDDTRGRASHRVVREDPSLPLGMTSIAAMLTDGILGALRVHCVLQVCCFTSGAMRQTSAFSACSAVNHLGRSLLGVSPAPATIGQGAPKALEEPQNTEPSERLTRRHPEGSQVLVVSSSATTE